MQEEGAACSSTTWRKSSKEVSPLTSNDLPKGTFLLDKDDVDVGSTVKHVKPNSYHTLHVVRGYAGLIKTKNRASEQICVGTQSTQTRKTR